MSYETSVSAMFSIFENTIMRHARDVIFPKFLTEFFQLALHTIVVEMIVTLVGIRKETLFLSYQFLKFFSFMPRKKAKSADI